MRFKNYLRTLKPDYDIYLWVKNFNETTATIYKNEVKLLQDFKQFINRKKKKSKKQNISQIVELEQIVDKKIQTIKESKESLEIPSPEYHPQSPSL
jgi:hypothetical protein